LTDHDVVTYEGRSLDQWIQRFRDGEAGRNEASRAFLAIGAATTLWQLRGRAARAVAALELMLKNDSDVMVRLRAAQALTGIAGKEHPSALAYLRSVERSTDPRLDAWIKAEATAILREAGVCDY
jgi:hypothetical protein